MLLRCVQIARGAIRDVETGTTLSAKQCLEIGCRAIAEKRYDQAVNWMETALARIQFENHKTASQTEVEIHLEKAKNMASADSQNSSKVRSKDDLDQIMFSEVCQGKRQQVSQPTSQYSSLLSSGWLFTLLMLPQTSQEEAKLFCWYEHQIHPYFRVLPLQVELLSRHPKTEVVMVHNVVGQRVLGFLRNDTSRKIIPMLPLTSVARLKKNSPEDYLRMFTLQLASRISGLRTDKENEILVNFHASGGFHKLHTDSVRLHVLVPKRLH